MAGTSRSGRKPKPTQLKLVQGNAGKRAINQDEPKGEVLQHIPECPEWIPGEGKEAWGKLAPWLTKNRILTGTDLHNLEAFCAAYGRWRDAEEHYALTGPVITGATGGPVKNPAATIINESLKQLSSFGAALGLDPASRVRLGGGGDDPQENPFAALLKKKGGK